MASTFGSFETAKSGLSVSMQQLNVTEQNIANVNTKGYTRQRLLTSAKEPPSSSYLIAQLSRTAVGQGVEATGIQQIRSSYLDQQFRSLNTSYTSFGTRDSGLDYLAGALNELNDDGSLTTSIKSFFTAMNTFTSDPSSQAYRTNVQKQAESMTESFRSVYEEMQSLWDDQNESIKTTAQTINSLAQKIAALNDAIASSAQTGGTPNDLNDERNLLLDELSGYVNIEYDVNPVNSNMIDVTIGGLSLVSGITANTVSVDSTSTQATVNSLLSDIASENAGTPPDTSALAVLKDQLKVYGSFTFTDNGSGGMDVSIDGVSLVTEGSVDANIEDAAQTCMGAQIVLKRNNLTVVDSTSAVLGHLSIENGTVTGGSLYANMELATSQSSSNPGIPYYMDQLNDLVREIAKTINDIHLTGYTYPDGNTVNINGVPCDSIKGVMFFQADPVAVDADSDGVQDLDADGYPLYDYTHAYDKLTAGNFALSTAVKESVWNIAGSSSAIDLNAPSPQTGNSEIALKLSQALTDNGYKDKLISLVNHLAISSKTAESITNTKESLLSSVDTQRKSLSAVSLDEETTNLIIFQQSYNAAARVITTLDDMLNTMINKMGIT